MTLSDWEKNGWLKPHISSKQEIGNLLAIVERDLKDAGQVELSPDWRFGIAYNAALKLCTILLYTSGYRPDKSLAHIRTIHALSKIMGVDKDDDEAYLDACRIKRNTVEYTNAGEATSSDAEELIDYVKDFKVEVEEWLNKRYPEFL